MAGWIRPVSDRESGELTLHDRRYPDGSDPRVLDIIDVPLLQPCPHGYQQENWLLDPGARWKKRGEWPESRLDALLDPPDPLWLDDDIDTGKHNDRIPEAHASAYRASLRLIRVQNLELKVYTWSDERGTRKCLRGCFTYQNADYGLRVTDPAYEMRYEREPDGLYPIGEAYLTISLGTPYKGHVYKLVAAVIEPSRRVRG